MAYERSTRWIEMVPHHPLYYLDFPDLKKILLKTDNWNDAFRGIFKSQEMLTGTLSELEPIRNKIAHHRLVSDQDRVIALSAYSKITEAVGQSRWIALLAQHTHAKDIKDRLHDLKRELSEIYCQCNLARRVSEDTVWKTIIDAWWFDSTYLNSSVAQIAEFFDIVEAYSSLPRFMGDGYKIEKWLADKNFKKLFDSAALELDILLI